MVRHHREKTKDYRIIFDLLDMKPRIQFTEIAENLGVDARTASRRLKEAVEEGYIVGPQIRKKSFSNFKTYVYLANSGRSLELFDEYIKDNHIIYHEVMEGFCNLLVMSDMKLDIDGTLLGGVTSDYYISHPPDQPWEISNRNMWDMVQKFNPDDYTPKGYIETHWNETVKWSEQYEILFWEFKYDLRKALEPLVKDKYHIWSGDGIEFLEQLSRYCTVFTCYFQEAIDNHDPYLYVFETDYEDFIIDLFSELPSTCWFQRVSNALIVHLWTPRGKMRKFDTNSRNVPELQISLLTKEFLRRGIIRKENHARRRFYARKEISDI
jgi:DNA-binding MarR family transcriptional regulator